MRWPAAFFVGWIILGIDVGVATSLSPGQRALPSFALPFLVFIALHAPTIAVMWTAFLLGLFIDLTSPRAESAAVVVGPHLLGFMAAAYFVLTVRGVMLRRRIVALIVLSIPAAMLAGLVSVFVLTIRSMYPGGLGVEYSPLGELWRMVLSSLLTGFSAAFVGFVMLPLHGIFHFHDSSRRMVGMRR
jgi:cell shape-determining protein MreD